MCNRISPNFDVNVLTVYISFLSIPSLAWFVRFCSTVLTVSLVALHVCKFVRKDISFQNFVFQTLSQIIFFALKLVRAV